MRSAARHQIETPEGIAFSFELAGPTSRFLAWGIDMLVKYALLATLGGAVLSIGVFGGGVAMAVLFLLYFAVDWGYNITLEYYWRGQTLGKRILGLRVMDEQGLHLAFNQIVVRNLLRVFDSIPYFYAVGGLAMVLSPRRQRLGDFAANTIVVRVPSVLTLDPVRTGEVKYNSFRAHPHIEARLRQKVTPEFAALAVEALARRETLEPAARLGIMRSLAEHLRACAAFPPEAVVGLADEQYVRNALDSLFRAKSG